MKILKVIIIMVVLLMVLNAGASELQYIPNESVIASEPAESALVAEEQEPQVMVLMEGITTFCEENLEDT